MTRRYSCTNCGKRYVIADWKQDPKCRQRGVKKGEHVTVYYTEEAGKKIARVFKHF